MLRVTLFTTCVLVVQAFAQTDIGWNDVTKKEMLDLHNEYRNDMSNWYTWYNGENTTLAKQGKIASNLKLVTWDVTLEKTARDVAERCEKDHIFPNDGEEWNVMHINHRRQFVGQNLAGLTSTMNCTLAATLWWREIQDYHIDTHKCIDGKKCGHFTAMAWDEVEFLGCACNACPDGNSHWVNVVCHYEAPPNVAGVQPFQLAEIADVTSTTGDLDLCTEANFEKDCHYVNLCRSEFCRQPVSDCADNADNPSYQSKYQTQECLLWASDPYNMCFKNASIANLDFAISTCAKTCGFCRERGINSCEGQGLISVPESPEKCFKFFSDASEDFEGAHQLCEQHGMRVFAPTDLMEMEMVTAAVRGMAPNNPDMWVDVHRIPMPILAGQKYSSVRDERKNGDNYYLTDEDGNKYLLPEDFWRIGQPNDYYKRDETCVAHRFINDASKIGADDRPCDFAEAVVMCEQPVVMDEPEQNIDDVFPNCGAYKGAGYCPLYPSIEIVNCPVTCGAKPGLEKLANIMALENAISHYSVYKSYDGGIIAGNKTQSCHCKNFYQT